MLNIEEDRDLSDLDGWNYTFIHDGGRTICSYGEYLANQALRDMVGDPDRYKLILGNVIFTYSQGFLQSHPDVVTRMRQFSDAKEQNPIRFFAPSGNEALNFLNDYENDICILTAPNRFGKTQTMLIKKILNSIPCDPNWEIFTKYGVKWRPFRIPKDVGLSTYDLGFHEDTTLKILLDWIPKNELGPYSTAFTGKGAKRVNFNDKPKLPLVCGSRFIFAATSQKQSPYEGNVKHEWGWDEQGTRAAFIGANERTRTFSGGRHDFALTPHKIEGRPDTGANSWIKKVWDGEENFGRKIGCYQAKVWSVPDWIYPEQSKDQAFYQHVIEPNGGLDGLGPMDDKARREGRSRFYGEWHEASGLVIDEWNPEVHLVDPFEIPHNWTLYRGVDHGGSKHPTACLWCAISPIGDMFVIKEYCRAGRVPSQNVREIVSMSNNSLTCTGKHFNPKNNMTYTKHEENFCGEKYGWTVFDGRAFSQTDTDGHMTLAKLYAIHGLKVVQGSGQNSDIYVPIMKEWFLVDWNRPHHVTGEMGAPRIYVFNSCKNFIRQIRGWTWEERKTKGNSNDKKESPSKKDDDLMDCLKLVIQKGPRFTGQISMMDRKKFGSYDMEDEETELYTGEVYDPISRY